MACRSTPAPPLPRDPEAAEQIHRDPGDIVRNLGPGLAGVGANYVDINDPAKWALSFAMLLGRLEVFTLMILFTPAFWRR